MTRIDDCLVDARRVYKSLNRYSLRWSPLEHRRHRETDVYMLWFPKTGGTWVRLLLNGALRAHTGITPALPLDFEAFGASSEDLPRLRPHNDDEPHWKRIDQLERDKRRFADKRVILLVRDMRDTAVSLFFQKTKRWKTYRGELADFVREPSGSVRTMIEFYNIWARQRHEAGAVHLVRYEDIHRDPRVALRQMLDFAGLERISNEHVEVAVAAASFETMRQREAGGEFDTSRLRPGIVGDGESYKARRGKVGGYVDYLSPRDVAWVSDYMRDHLDPWYGYATSPSELDAAPAPSPQT